MNHLRLGLHEPLIDRELDRLARGPRLPHRCLRPRRRRAVALLALLPARGTEEPTHRKPIVSWCIAGAPGEGTCDPRREVYVALPPGPDLGARINPAFARGAVDLSTVPDPAR